jgi:peptide/nickel transport system substrate-binding protein
MHRNPDYWERDSAGVRLPYLEAIHVDFAADMSAEFQGLVQGKYDFMSGLHVAYMDALLDDDGDLRDSWNGRLRMERIPFLKTDYIGIQMDSALVHPALADRRVRQALSLAIDRQAMARHLRRGSVMPSARFVPPSMLGETKNTNTLELASALGPVPAFDRDSARALLAAGGYPGGEGIDRLTLSTTSDYTDLCASLQSQWAAIGIDIAIDVVQSSTHRENVSNGQATLFRKSWLADYPDAENFLALFLDLNDAPSGPNYTRYSHPDFERLYRQALLLADAADRQPLYRAMDDLIATELPVIPLFHDQVTHFLRPEIEGWAISPVNRLDLRRVKKRARN